MSAAVGVVEGREEAIGCKGLDMWSIGSCEFEGVDMTSRRGGWVEGFETRRLGGEEYGVVGGELEGGRRKVGGGY